MRYDGGMTYRLILTNEVTAILKDANTRPDPTFAHAILDMLEKGTIHTPATNLLDRDDRRNLVKVRLAMVKGRG